jgi:hypothetical protein
MPASELNGRYLKDALSLLFSVEHSKLIPSGLKLSLGIPSVVP